MAVFRRRARLEHFGSVAKEVVMEFFGGTEEEFGVEVLPFKDLVHVASCVRHLLGEPAYAAPLGFQQVFD